MNERAIESDGLVGPTPIDGGGAGLWLALASLPDMGPARLLALHRSSSSDHAWRVVSSGRAHLHRPLQEVMGTDAAGLARRWAMAAAATDVAALWATHADVSVSILGDAGYPARLVDDTEPPVVVLARGDTGALDGPTVAVVGTRRCTRAGAEVARWFGSALAEAGARVVSGLATGIDAAAHAGALSVDAAPPIGVVGSGLDVVYPSRNRALWDRVGTVGVLLSECPLGTPPARWRFPARNRLVAALADVVVVVESPKRGGSMYTVAEALARDRPVLAVPGPVRSPAAEGTNWLLAEGATVACSPADVLAAVGLSPVPGSPDGPCAGPDDRRPRPVGDAGRVLRALGWEPGTLDQLARATGLPLGALAVAVDALETGGWIVHAQGRLERVGSR